jgi:hypothetical protein
MVLVVAAAAVLSHGVQLTLVAVGRDLLDRHQQVGELRLEAAYDTFRPAGRSGLAAAADPATFAPDRNPRTSPAACRPLTVLATRAPLDGRTWTGVNGRPAQPVTLLTVRYADADEARDELDRKRWALLRCPRAEVTFPPYDAPPTTYDVRGPRWARSAVGSTVRWSLVGDGRRFDFYVLRYGNTLTWTYADDVSTPAVREEVADSLGRRLEELARS